MLAAPAPNRRKYSSCNCLAHDIAERDEGGGGAGLPRSADTFAGVCPAEAAGWLAVTGPGRRGNPACFPNWISQSCGWDFFLAWRRRRRRRRRRRLSRNRRKRGRGGGTSLRRTADRLSGGTYISSFRGIPMSSAFCIFR